MIPMPTWIYRLVRLSRWEYFADFWITPPVTVILTALSLRHGISPNWVLSFLAGWFIWTFYEYGIHRISHHVPWLADLHVLHHRNQRAYIGVHPAVTLVLYAAVWLAFGFRQTPLAIGFSVGHVVYGALHVAFHYAQIKEGGWLWPLKRHHVAHHRFHDRCFGVTTTLWDRVFRTI